MIYSGSTHDSSSLTCITWGPELIFDMVVLACEGLGGQYLREAKEHLNSRSCGNQIWYQHTSIET